MSNFIVFSLAGRWNVDYGCNVKDICLELSKTHRVLFVDVPLKRRDRWLKKTRKDVVEVEERIKTKKQLVQLAPNLWHYIDDSILESVNKINNNFLFDLVNSINNFRYAKAIKRAAKQVGFDTYYVFNDNAIYDGYRLKKLLKPLKYIYYLRDHVPAMAYWSRHAGRLQPKIIKDADVVFTNSNFLLQYAQQWNKNAHYVGQGCDVDHFLKQPDPEVTLHVCKKYGQPLIGYIGALNSERLDIDLLHTVAKQMPNHNFLLIGKEDQAFQDSELHKLWNVYFTGPVDFSLLPGYLYGFNVAINPQRLNEITVGNYPRKIDEYLAAGVPVVATRTLTMEAFGEIVYLAEDADGYVQLIEKAIAENTLALQQERKHMASMHTWENSVKEMLKHLE